jgi:threonine/homoserine/homoserine lactone efflux protein
MNTVRQKETNWLFQYTAGFCICMAIITITSFILYVLARMREQDQKEKRYRTIHFLSLGLFVLLGVFLLILLSNEEP